MRGVRRAGRPLTRPSGFEGVPVPESTKRRSNGVCAYLRVSSASQSVEMQRRAVLEASRAAGDIVGTWFEDTSTGGPSRQGSIVLRKMLDWARLGKMQRLYVYRLDRLSRRGIRDLLALVQELESLHVEIVTIADGFTLAAHPARDVILSVMAWAAQMERLAIGERIRSARARIEAKGGNWGRPRRWTTQERNQVRTMLAAGKTVREIAVALKIPRGSLWRLARKPVKARRRETLLKRTG